MAHIVAESADGPRGDDPLPLDQRNHHANLMLLCNIHHQEIDDPENSAYYTVERLRGLKEKHQHWVTQTLARAYGERPTSPQPRQITETLFSNLLPVDWMPRYIYGVPCDLPDDRAVRALLQAAA